MSNQGRGAVAVFLSSHFAGYGSTPNRSAGAWIAVKGPASGNCPIGPGGRDPALLDACLRAPRAAAQWPGAGPGVRRAQRPLDPAAVPRGGVLESTERSPEMVSRGPGRHGQGLHPAASGGGSRSPGPGGPVRSLRPRPQGGLPASCPPSSSVSRWPRPESLSWARVGGPGVLSPLLVRGLWSHPITRGGPCCVFPRPVASPRVGPRVPSRVSALGRGVGVPASCVGPGVPSRCLSGVGVGFRPPVSSQRAGNPVST